MGSLLLRSSWDREQLAESDLHLSRIEPKHFLRMSELLQGGSRLLYRPGTGALHVGPDAISRRLDWKDKLILAKASEWTRHRAMIVAAVQLDIERRAFDDEEPEIVQPSQLPPEVGHPEMQESKKEHLSPWRGLRGRAP